MIPFIGTSSACVRGVVLIDPVLVGAAGDGFDPGGVVEVPLDGLAEAGLEGFGGVPAEFGFDLAGVDGVAAVVAGTVLHVGDELDVRRRASRGGARRAGRRGWTTSRLARWLPPPTL
jgi:hypothetical protein